MKRLPCIIPLVFLIFGSVACGNISVRGAIQPGIVSGLVSIVQLSEVGGTNGTVQVTFVTFLQNGTSSVIGFCGDQRSFFPMDQTIRAQFDRGQTCNNIIQITVT
ncbi:MAG TPA: hypothetical protein VMO80_15550 [Terriglobales bacterium]|nr:hypothetical protein [Terriglobales bacterium]